MTIKNKFKLTVLILLTSAVVLGYFIFFQVGYLDLANKQYVVTHNIIKTIISRRILLLNYLIYSSDQYKADWHLKTAEIVKLAEQATIFDNAEEREIVKEIKESSEHVDNIFKDFRLGVLDDTSQEVILGEIIKTSEDNINGAYRLEDLVLIRTSGLMDTIISEIFWAIFAYIILILGIFLYFSRYVFVPLDKLRSGISHVIAGRMDYRLDKYNNDEIGEISESFNVMVDRLREFQESLEGIVKEKTSELSKKMIELEKMNSFMVDREIRMSELKKEIEELRSKK